MQLDEELSNVSSLENEEKQDEDYNDFKDAILNNTYSDEYNLSEKDLEKLTSKNVENVIQNILNTVFIDNKLVPLVQISNDLANRLPLYSLFQELYSIYLGRNLEKGEQNVFNTAIKIIFWKIHGKTFKNICWYRYSYASKTHEREKLEREGQRTDRVEAAFYTEYRDLPDKEINVYNSLNGIKACNVDYDLIMYDTYDYIDKLIGFKLSDIFFAAFIKYHEKSNDERALKLAKFMKYGTDNEKHIWMLRYGLSFEDIEIIDNHILSINSEQIVFNDTIQEVPDNVKKSIIRFINN